MKSWSWTPNRRLKMQEARTRGLEIKMSESTDSRPSDASQVFSVVLGLKELCVGVTSSSCGAPHAPSPLTALLHSLGLLEQHVEQVCEAFLNRGTRLLQPFGSHGSTIEARYLRLEM